MTTTEKLPDLIAQLRDAFSGVIGPDDAGYEEGRSVYLAHHDRRPAAIVRPADANEVARVIEFAHERGFDLAVRSGGHSYAGHGVSDGALVLDLARLKALEIDVANHAAWAETGLTAAEVTKALAPHGLAVAFGDTSTVGIGGLTLGGGIGYLVRKYGLTIDDLLAAEIATADGQILEVDAEHHSDLFWAIRGGGGNFGVATAEAAPEELSAIVNVMLAPPVPAIPREYHGTAVVMAKIVHDGPTELGKEAVAPFRALAEPITDMLRPMAYPEMFPPEPDEQRWLAGPHTMFLDHLDHTAAERILERINSSTAQMPAVQLRVLGGAMARVPVDATAFAHRPSKILVTLAAFYTSPDEKPTHQSWLSELAAALQQTDTGAYVNFLSDENSTRVRAAYPDDTWNRLTAIKHRYDPTNLFRLNQNIPPEGQRSA